jgi:light-independent protochlorophyllide reductase subunit B
MVKFLRDELAMNVAGAGTYLYHEENWVREQLDGYIHPDTLLVTDHFQDVARRIAELAPDLVCGTQMERHSSRKLDMSCMVIAPPTHIENHLLSYTPILGFAGADYLADKVYTSTKLGLEKHLIDMFGDAGLEYDDGSLVEPDDHRPVSTVHDLTWHADAEKMLKRVPFFVRGRVRRNTEKFAADNGHTTVTADILQEAREALGG